MMIKSQENYLQTLSSQCEKKQVDFSPTWLKNLRNEAASELQNSRIPSKNDEDWRFTDLSDILQYNFRLASPVILKSSSISGVNLPETTDSLLVFVNGVYEPKLSNVSGIEAGVYAGNLIDLPEAQTVKLINYLEKQETSTEEVFATLNTSGLTDAAVIWVGLNVVVEKPINLLFLSVASESPTFTQPRTLIVAERFSNVKIVEYYGTITEHCSDTPNSKPYLTNSVTQIWLEDSAIVNHSRIQRDSGDAFHIAYSAISQSRDSQYTCNEISLGAKFYRHNLAVLQTGEQTQTNLNGLTMIGGNQFADTHSVISLTKPHGTANQLHKYIIDDRAQGVFNGKILVPSSAQMTNAAQLNRNLLLSPTSGINTKPELQITADNVKCSHGATVSQLEAEEIFYLRSRGLTEFDARHLLVDAFAAEIIENIPLKSLRERLTQCVACRTPN